MIHLVGEDARTVPDWFRRRLRDIDPALVVYFNPFREQFCIDRCVKGRDCLSSNHVECEKTNVMLFPHMGEQALDDLKKMDSWTNFGGNNEDALLRMRRDHEIAKEEHDEKLRQTARENYAAGAREDRVQLNKVLHLMQQHDTARVH